MSRIQDAIKKPGRGPVPAAALSRQYKLNVPYMLKVVARLQTTRFMSRLSSTGVHPSESFVLLELYSEEPLSQAELSRRLDIGNATVGQTLKRLELGKFVERGRFGPDQRMMMVRLTDKGRAVQQNFIRQTEALTEEIAGVLGRAEAETMLRALIKLADYFRA